MLIYSQIWESMKNIQIIPITRNKCKLTKIEIYYFIHTYFEKLNTPGLIALFLSQVFNFSFDFKFIVCFLSISLQASNQH